MQLSFIHGEPFGPSSGVLANYLVARQDQFGHQIGTSNNLTASQLAITIIRSDNGVRLASLSVPANKSDIEVEFVLQQFPPSLKPYGIQVTATGAGAQSFKATTNLYRLPNPTDGRTITKIDNLYQSLLIQQDGQWQPFFPYSFYMDSKWISPTPAKLGEFAGLGYNVLHVVPGYDFDWFDTVADEAEKLGLWIMYDFRGTYKSAPDVKMQVERYGKRKNMLLWYTADEPGKSSPPRCERNSMLNHAVDGVQDPLNAPKDAYDQIKSLDPYRPISLVLNCANYFFEPYMAGADILLTDPYPIGTNTSWSTEWKYDTLRTNFSACTFPG